MRGKRRERSYVKDTLHQNGISSLLSAHHLGRRMILDPASPYHTLKVSEMVTKTLSDNYVQVHMKPFRTLRRILSHSKDRVSDDDKSSIVYKINCHDCDASYVGRTHMSEHRKGSGEDGLLCFCSSTACVAARPSH